MQAAPPMVEAHHRVLVVDDDVRSRDAVAQILGEEGYDAAVASDGEEACSLLASWRPELVVTDLNMPRLDGRGLLQRVHTVLPGIPVIILSARGVAEAGRLTEGMGAAGFFAKPVRVEDLLARIRALIGS
jgi:DNA-binding response OmpR family regulator